MGVLPVSYSSKVCPLDNADCFIEYLEVLLVSSKRALVSIEHFVRLRYLTVRNVLITREELAKMGQQVSLIDGNYADLVDLARKRIAKGDVPDNWLELFNNIILEE